MGIRYKIKAFDGFRKTVEEVTPEIQKWLDTLPQSAEPQMVIAGPVIWFLYKQQEYPA